MTTTSLDLLSLQVIGTLRDLLISKQKTSLLPVLVRAVVIDSGDRAASEQVASSIISLCCDSAAAALQNSTEEFDIPLLLLPHIVDVIPQEDPSTVENLHSLFKSLLALYFKTESRKEFALAVTTLAPVFKRSHRAGDILEEFFSEVKSFPPSAAGVVAKVTADVIPGHQVINWNSILLESNGGNLSPHWTSVFAANASQGIVTGSLLLQQISAALLGNDRDLQKHAVYLLQRICELQIDCSDFDSKKFGTLTFRDPTAVTKFIALYTTLDEKQLHIISPVIASVLPDLQKSCLKTFYVIALVKMLGHDNRAVVREGLARSVSMGKKLGKEDFESYVGYLGSYVIPVIKESAAWVLISGDSAVEYFRLIGEMGGVLRGVFNYSNALMETVTLMVLDVIAGEGKSVGPASVFFFVDVLFKSLLGFLPGEVRDEIATAVPNRPPAFLLQILHSLTALFRSCLRTLETFLLRRVTRMALEIAVFFKNRIIHNSQVTAAAVTDLVAALPRDAVRDNCDLVAEIGRDLNLESNCLGAVRIRVCSGQEIIFGDDVEVIVDAVKVGKNLDLEKLPRDLRILEAVLETSSARVSVEEIKNFLSSVTSDDEINYWRALKIRATFLEESLDENVILSFLSETCRKGNQLPLFTLQMETLSAVKIDDATPVVEKTLEKLSTLGGTSGEGAVPALKFFLSAGEFCSDEVLQEFARTAWRMISEARRSDAFAQALALFSRGVVRFGGRGLLGEYASKILTLGETVLTAPLTLVTAMEQENLVITDVDLWSEVLTALMTSGPPVPKAAKGVHIIVQDIIEREACCDLKDELPLTCMAGPVARYRAVCVVRRIVSGSSAPGLLEKIVQRLLEVESEDRGRYFENSWTHRRKQRALQALVALQQFFDKPLEQKVTSSLLDSLGRDSPQPSVRYLAEWIVARGVAGESVDNWDRVFFDISKKVWRGGRLGFGSLFSSISLQTWKILILSKKSGRLVDFVEKTLPLLSELILGNHKTVRVYAQVIFERIFREAREILVDSVEKFAQLFQSLEESRKELLSGNARKILEATESDFFVHKFCPVGHNCDRVVFQLLPLLAGVARDEVIVWGRGESWDAPGDVVELFSSSSNNCWHLKNVHVGVAEESASLFQRKIVPQDLVQEMRLRTCRNSTSLIVVGSLLERIPNLGGLCRTCEVFGASTFVVPSLKVLEDLNFTSLSVSAQNWVDCVAVAPGQLEGYLLKMAAEGFQVVALEQTSKSVCINEFRFPRKTVLLLGNEKTGLPAPLLASNIIDACVEIPQVGVVRSLNVHVSGAIAIWCFFNQFNGV